MRARERRGRAREARRRREPDARRRRSASRGSPPSRRFATARSSAEFTGAIPPAQVEAVLRPLLPSAADKLADAGDEESLRAALEQDPRHAGAAVELGRLLIGAASPRRPARCSSHATATSSPAGLLARLELEAERRQRRRAGDLAAAFAAWDAGDPDAALELLQAAIAGETDPERRDLIRRVMVAIFTELGADHPLAREHRRRLAAALN